MGHTYDLIVNGLLDAKSRQPLPYLKVTSVGKTEPLKVDWVAAFNHALEEPVIRIKFNDEINPAEATPDRIRIEPPVKEMRLLASRDEVQVNGQFDLMQRYRVTISPGIKRRAWLWPCRRVAMGRNVSSERAMCCFPGFADFSACAARAAVLVFPGQYSSGDMEARAHSAGEIAGCDCEGP